MGSPHPKDLQISFGGFTQLVELDLGPIPGSRICELVTVELLHARESGL